jgi:hypothetical protein
MGNPSTGSGRRKRAGSPHGGPRTVMEAVSGGCANFRGGRCRGIAIDAASTMPIATCLIKLGLGCTYFERCVLSAQGGAEGPAGIAYDNGLARDERGAVDALEDEGLREAILASPFWGHSAEIHRAAGRYCECGEPLAPRERVCEACRVAQDRAGRREGKGRVAGRSGGTAFSPQNRATRPTRPIGARQMHLRPNGVHDAS